MFAARLNRDGAGGAEFGVVVRDTLNGMLGELSAVATLSYAGDATDGDFLGFATRIEELFGSSTTMLLNGIIVVFEARLLRSTIS